MEPFAALHDDFFDQLAEQLSVEAFQEIRRIIQRLQELLSLGYGLVLLRIQETAFRLFGGAELPG